VPQLQVGELAFPRVGSEAGEPVPVDVGEPQLRPGVRALLADDDRTARISQTPAFGKAFLRGTRGRGRCRTA
jgi:hypothetical protein